MHRREECHRMLQRPCGISCASRHNINHASGKKVVMQFEQCLHCGTQVVPTADGNCPSCRRSFHEIPENVDPRQIQLRIDAEAAALCPPLAEALATSYRGPRMVTLSAEHGVTIDFGC